jgi:hypothetical protein
MLKARLLAGLCALGCPGGRCGNVSLPELALDLDRMRDGDLVEGDLRLDGDLALWGLLGLDGALGWCLGGDCLWGLRECLRCWLVDVLDGDLCGDWSRRRDGRA